MSNIHSNNSFSYRAPSKGQKASEPSKPRPKANPHAGAHRPLHPNPTRERIVSAHVCQDCGADVSNVAQSAVQVYDRIEIPKVEPDVTRVTLRGGVCPCCARRFKAPAPEGLEPGSPFGPNLRALVIYLRSVQGTLTKSKIVSNVIKDDNRQWDSMRKKLNLPNAAMPGEESLRKAYTKIIRELGRSRRTGLKIGI